MSMSISHVAALHTLDRQIAATRQPAACRHQDERSATQPARMIRLGDTYPTSSLDAGALSATDLIGVMQKPHVQIARSACAAFEGLVSRSGALLNNSPAPAVARDVCPRKSLTIPSCEALSSDT